MKLISILIALLPAAFVQGNEANEALLAACMAGRGFDSVIDVKAAIEDGADINATDEKSGQTALMAAVLRGKINIVKHLLEAGADTSIGEKMGYTPPHGAAFQGRPDVMKVLIDAGLDVNEYHDDGFVPLHRVCWGGEDVSSTKKRFQKYFQFCDRSI